MVGCWLRVYLEAFILRYASTTLSRSSSSILRLPAETCVFAAFLLGLLGIEFPSCFSFSFSINKNDLGCGYTMHFLIHTRWHPRKKEKQTFIYLYIMLLFPLKRVSKTRHTYTHTHAPTLLSLSS